MAVTTIYVQSAVTPAGTYNATSGGPVRVRFTYSGDPLEDRTADQVFAAFLAVVNQRAIVRVTIRELKQLASLGVKGSIALTLVGKTNTVTVNFANMVYLGIDGEQGRADMGSGELMFQYESADGFTAPIS